MFISFLITSEIKLLSSKHILHILYIVINADALKKRVKLRLVSSKNCY